MNISISIPEQKKREIDDLAAHLDRSRSWIINVAVEGYLERQRLLRTEIHAAVADADANPNDVVEHDHVAAEFVASLKSSGGR